jgi:general secretion pathway protein J
MKRHRAGFTLIELLIALGILGLFAVLGYRGLAALTESEAKLAAEAAHWGALDTLFARLEADARAAVPRDVRTGAGSEAAWVGDVDPAGDANLRFSRAGPEFAAEPGSGGQRIGYRLRNGAVEVLYWPFLDQPSTVVPEAYALIDGVAAFRVAYLDARGTWRERWPMMGEPAIPRAIRVELTLAGGEVIERWLALR